MTSGAQAIPPRTMRTASIIILCFAAVFLLFGQGMFQAASGPVKTAQELQVSGLQGTVIDARSEEGRSGGNGASVSGLEVTFIGVDGVEHTMETSRFPFYHPAVNAPNGWADEFATKDEIVGQTVTYRLGERPAAELTSLLPGLASEGWSFPNYLGTALMVMGAGAAVGGTVSLVRSIRRIRSEKS